MVVFFSENPKVFPHNKKVEIQSEFFNQKPGAWNREESFLLSKKKNKPQTENPKSN